ncbi:probable cytochrome P450 6d5 [Contarinia nasturtii]|uniref:probable cytochrome P450 6d5 n=1 Tax=Contarinia nasturtii TaxID=265458 RepID=UPI0012D4BF33|nr:probable cytochrome P450 6d5 [Contarinia nasturtii]
MALISGSWKLDILTILLGVITLIYLFFKRKYSYWQRKGFNSNPDITFPFGNFKRTFLQKEHFVKSIDRIYHATTEPFIGIYTVFRPTLMIREPELIRTILIKDFNHFTDRGIHCDEENDPLSANLLALPGQKWKHMRSKLTPAFSSGKLKAMFSTLLDCGSTLQNYLGKLAENGEMLDVREISASHSTNVIASVAFGIDVDCINDPDNKFRVCGRQIFDTGLSNSIRTLLGFIAPQILKLFRLKFISPEVQSFITSVVKQNLEYREKNHMSRKDFFQLLIQLRNSGTVQLDDEWKTVTKADENQKSLTLNDMSAQTYLFFAAGFETSSSTLSFCMYELAKNPEIQEKVHEEIDRVLAQHGGKVTYDSVTEMKYLENCIDETLRKFIVAVMLTRTCVKTYKIPGTDKIIEKGVEVMLPIFSLHRDEKYYENPNKFDPDRFNEENSAGKNYLNRPYYPFGDGPRNCIGMRLGKMQVKVGLIMMLQKNKFELEDRLKNEELRIDPTSFLLSPFGGIKLHVSEK